MRAPTTTVDGVSAERLIVAIESASSKLADADAVRLEGANLDDTRRRNDGRDGRGAALTADTRRILRMIDEAQPPRAAAPPGPPASQVTVQVPHAPIHYRLVAAAQHYTLQHPHGQHRVIDTYRNQLAKNHRI